MRGWLLPCSISEVNCHLQVQLQSCAVLMQEAPFGALGVTKVLKAGLVLVVLENVPHWFV